MNVSRRNAFSIVEALMALTLLALVLIPMLTLGLSLDRQSEMDRRYEEALAAAQAGLERCRSEAFTALDGQDRESDHGAVHVTVAARQVEPGLLKLTATATWACEWRMAPNAMARATGSLTAPCRSIRAASTPSICVLAAFEYRTRRDAAARRPLRAPAGQAAGAVAMRASVRRA